MSTFKDASWSARFATLGDPAEQAFATLWPSHHRSGLNRPALNVAKLSLKDRNTPDFLTNDGYCECMGVGGRAPSLKLKAEKMIALCMWDGDTRCDLFVWDSTRRRYWRAPIWSWVEACVMYGEVKTFPDNDKPYFDLKPVNFPIDPTSIVDALPPTGTE